MRKYLSAILMFFVLISFLNGENTMEWNVIKEEAIKSKDNSAITIKIVAKIEKNLEGNYLRDDSEQWRIIIKEQTGKDIILFDKNLKMACIDMFLSDNYNTVCFVIDTSEYFEFYELRLSSFFKKYSFQKKFKRNKSKPNCILHL